MVPQGATRGNVFDDSYDGQQASWDDLYAAKALTAKQTQLDEAQGRKAELLKELSAAHDHAGREAAAAAAAVQRATVAEGEASALRRQLREVATLRKRLGVKETHVSDLQREIEKQGAEIAELRAQLDTPEGLVKEMLKMAEKENKLRAQIAAETEAKLNRQIKELEKELTRHGINTRGEERNVLSFSSFFGGGGCSMYHSREYFSGIFSIFEYWSDFFPPLMASSSSSLTAAKGSALSRA